MTGFEWFLLVVVVIVVPLVVAVAVTLWTLEMARQRKRQNRPASDAGAPVKRRATRSETSPEAEASTGARGVASDGAVVSASGSGDVGADTVASASDDDDAADVQGPLPEPSNGPAR